MKFGVVTSRGFELGAWPCCLAGTDTATVIDLLQRAKDQHGTGPPEKSEGTSKTTPQSGQKKRLALHCVTKVHLRLPLKMPMIT